MGERGRVLFVASVYSHLVSFHKPFMEMFFDRGYEVHAAASFDNRVQLQQKGITCWQIPFRRSPYNFMNTVAFWKLRSLLSRVGFDLIHVHTPVAAFLTRYLAKQLKQRPVLYTAHGFHFYDGAPKRNWVIYHTAERIAKQWTDGIVVLNREDYESAAAMGYIPGRSLFYVHGVGVNLNVFSSKMPVQPIVRNELGLSPDQRLVTCIAELNANKNQGFLLDAWRRLVARRDNCHLLLVGDGEKLNTLKGKVSRERIDRVHFLGYRRDIPQILQESDIFTLVSKREGLPKSVMEAMAAGKPIVATNIRGNRELIENGRNGILVELGDLDGLIDALDHLLGKSALRLAMGRESRKMVRRYSLDNVLAEMISVYNNFLYL